MFAGNFEINGWAFCDGRLLPIAENEALFTLIGTTYGGDGQETFALPNLNGRVPMHGGTGGGGSYQLGELGGVESVTLTTQQIPVHNHAMLASDAPADQLTVNANLPAEATKRFFTAPPGTPVNLAADGITPVGGSQPHDNMQPYLVYSFLISLFGIFPQFN